MHVVWLGHGRESMLTPKDLPLTDSRSDTVSSPGQLCVIGAHSLVAPSVVCQVVMPPAGPDVGPPPTPGPGCNPLTP